MVREESMEFTTPTNKCKKITGNKTKIIELKKIDSTQISIS